MTELLITLLMFILPPCQHEDSSWCTWSAQEQGNGQGTSFVSLTEDIIIYID